MIHFFKLTSPSQSNLPAYHRSFIGGSRKNHQRNIASNAIFPSRCSSTRMRTQLKLAVPSWAGVQMMQMAFCSARCITTPSLTKAAVTSLRFPRLSLWRRGSPRRTHIPFKKQKGCRPHLHMCTPLPCTCANSNQ